jgi:hypothetical protein
MILPVRTGEYRIIYPKLEKSENFREYSVIISVPET